VLRQPGRFSDVLPREQPLRGRQRRHNFGCRYGFFPFGMAIDNTRGFIYVSNALGNSISVYNASGQLLTTITN
jgi:hypothetical protein